MKYIRLSGRFVNKWGKVGSLNNWTFEELAKNCKFDKDFVFDVFFDNRRPKVREDDFYYLDNWIDTEIKKASGELARKVN